VGVDGGGETRASSRLKTCNERRNLPKVPKFDPNSLTAWDRPHCPYLSNFDASLQESAAFTPFPILINPGARPGLRWL